MSKRVLVIDDETNIRRMMYLTLEADGYEVEEAADGMRGLETFGDGTRFDAVLLDQKMPGMDGVDVLQQIKKRAPAARVIMVTAFGSIELAVEAMKLGATDFLRKPLTPETLRAAVSAALGKTPGSAVKSPAAPAYPLPMPPVEIWTVNGFFIRTLTRPGAVNPTDYLFGVRHAQRGPQGEVLVTINPAEVIRVSREIGKPLAPSGAYWQQRAERALVNHLFREAAMPPDNRLVVDRITDDALVAARNWTAD